jgi:hypothetical protein
MSRFDQASRKALLTLGVASLTVTGLLAACGGGNSSGPPPPPSSSGNTIPPSSGPGDAENFFPNATGNAWYYDTTTTLISGPTATSMDRILLTGQKSVLGESSSVFQDTVIQDPTTPAAPTEDYYFKNAGGVSYMGSNAPNDALSAAFVPYIEVLFPVAPATVASFGKSNVNAGDLDGDGKSDTATLTLTAKVEDFEALDTALGSLPRTVRTTESLSGNVTLSSNNASVPLSAISTTWSAPGIGVVKRTVSVTVQGKTQTQESDIRGYLTDTGAQGLTTPYVIQSDIAGNSPVFQAGQPALGTDGTHFLALENTPNGIVGTLFDLNAKVLATVNLGTGGSTPSVSWDGSNYIVALGGSSDLVIHRVSPEGVDLDAPGGITVNLASAPTGVPAVGSGSGNSLIAYSRFDSATSQHFMYGVLIDHNGQVITPGEFPIAVDLATHWFPQVSFDGTNYLVVWQQLPSAGADQTLAHINGARVTVAGAVLDSPSIAISSTPLGQYSPVVAFDGTNYFVAWTDGRRGQAQYGMYDIYGARVTPAGAVLDASGIAVDAGGTQRRTYQSIAYTGSEYLIAWSDYAYGNGGSVGVRLARMAPDGSVTTPAGGLALSGAPPSQPPEIYAYTSMAAGTKTAAVTFVNAYGTGTLLGTLGYGF